MVEAKLEISNLITPIINSFKILDKEWKNLFDFGLSDYLYVQTEKYFFTNTFIHRSEKVKFYDIYYPVKANYKALTTDFNDLKEIFDNYKNITIIGSAGSGKTTLMRHIFLGAIKNKNRIPVLIELRNLNEYNGDFDKLITEKILKSKVKPSDTTFRRALNSGRFLFLLDGYDEIFSAKKQEIKRQIELFVDAYPNNRFLMTTRPGSGIEAFPRFYDFKICELNDDDVIEFVNILVNVVERKERILTIIKNPENKSYSEYLKNPLLLSMFILAFESHPEIPQKRSAFYRNVFDTLYSKHDSITKNSFPREKLTKLQREDFERILNVFSYLSLAGGTYSYTYEYLSDVFKKIKKTTNYDFTIEDLIFDLQTSISIIILDGFEYNFPHRSLQEYFAAQFVSNLPSEKKKKVYTNLAKIIEASSMDGGNHFWSLCNELDSVSFTSHFLIPQLKEYQKLLNHSTDRDLLIAYFTITNANLYYYSSGPGLDGVSTAIVIGAFSNIIDFCNIGVKLYSFSFTSEIGKKILSLYESDISEYQIDDGTPIDFQIYDNDKLIDILIDYKIANGIKEFNKSLSNKIQLLQAEVERENKNIDTLLDL